MVQTLFCLCLEHSGIRPLAACFGTFAACIGGKLDNKFFSSQNE